MAGVPVPDSDGGDFDPFLKAEVIGKLGKTASVSIIGPPEETPDAEFSDLQIPVKYKGTQYAWGMKVGGGNYPRLYKRFGKNPKKWRGTVKVEVKHFKKNNYIAVV